MADKTTKKQIITNLIDLGKSNAEIMEILPVSDRYIRKVRHNLGYTSQKISTEKYYKAIQNNTGTKEELAAKLGVSERTLNYYEEDNIIKKQVAQYLRAKGMGLHSIAVKMGTSISILKEMGIDRLPDVRTVIAHIETLTQIFEAIAQWDAEAATLFYQWKKALDRLK
ncbi:MAG: hypothetical protein K2L89_01225 [Muribaculaceae bacterium]|nr:hypothetical protein [Muribaculaceae bacterium]